MVERRDNSVIEEKIKGLEHGCQRLSSEVKAVKQDVKENTKVTMEIQNNTKDLLELVQHMAWAKRLMAQIITAAIMVGSLVAAWKGFWK